MSLPVDCPDLYRRRDVEVIMIDCRYYPLTYPDFVRTKGGAQRSGYRLLLEHTLRRHSCEVWGERQRAIGVPARIDDACPHCEGKGCSECEPNGPVAYNFNTLELLRS